MTVAQVRLPEGMVKQVDELVESKMYSNRSDVIRDAVRRFVLEKELKNMIGSTPNTGDSVKEVREIRKKLSKEFKESDNPEKLLEEINNL